MSDEQLTLACVLSPNPHTYPQLAVVIPITDENVRPQGVK